MPSERISTGLLALDEMLGGGLIPGTTTVIRGKYGSGKSILGTHIAHAGIQQDKYPGLIADVSNGDSQNHIQYAHAFLGWDIKPWPCESRALQPSKLKKPTFSLLEHPYCYNPSMNFESTDPSRCLGEDFFFIHQLKAGAKRVVIDGIDPYRRISERSQIGRIYDCLQQLWKGRIWEIGNYQMDVNDLTLVVLETTSEQNLKSMMTKEWEDPTLLAQANTVIYLGDWTDGAQLGQEVPTAIYISKHRGSSLDKSVRQMILRDDQVIFPHYSSESRS